MKSFHLNRPSPALIISTVALLVALGGTGFAAFALPKNSVGSKQLKNGAVTNKKLRNAAVGTNQIANGAVTSSKMNLSGVTVPNANRASSADNANALQGQGPSSFAPSAIEAAHVVGAAGEPAYENSWFAPPGSPHDEGVSFYKDPWGIVHLQGSAEHTVAATGTIFTLPAGYRPAGPIWVTDYGAGDSTAYVNIKPDGTVNEDGIGQTYVSLTSVTFRAGL
jgi:hypothetical protein